MVLVLIYLKKYLRFEVMYRAIDRVTPSDFVPEFVILIIIKHSNAIVY